MRLFDFVGVNAGTCLPYDRQPVGEAPQGQDGLAKGIVLLTVGEPLHQHAPFGVTHRSGIRGSCAFSLQSRTPVSFSSTAPNARSVAFCASVRPLVPVILSRS